MSRTPFRSIRRGAGQRLALLLSAALFACAALQAGAQEPAKNAEVKPAAGITISKETTYLEGPLREDGRIDYLAALNSKLSEGVTPANNAAVPLYTHITLETFDAPLFEAMRAKFFEQMGVEAPPLDGPRVVESARFVRESAMGGPEAVEAFAVRFHAQVASARERPWSKEEHPEVAAWIEKNKEPLESIVAGLARPRYYMPLVANEEDGFTLVAILLPGISNTRDLGQLLLARAMLRLKDGDLAGAQADAIACHRLARHVASGPTLIEALVGIALDNMACNADAALARSGKLSADQLRAHAAELAGLPRTIDMAAKIDTAERYMYLDCVMTVAVKGAGELGELGGEEESPLMKAIEKILGTSLVDWNEPLRVGNTWYDKMVAAARKTPYAEKAKAMAAFDDELKAFAGEARDPAAMLRRIFFSGESPRKAIGRQLGNILIALLLPAVNQAVLAEDRQMARIELTRLTLLLEAYRAEHGAYPAALGMLAPKYVEKLPQDPFHDADFVYRTADKGGDKGYLLYSVGPNQTDDGGAGEGTGRGELDDVYLPSGTPE